MNDFCVRLTVSGYNTENVAEIVDACRYRWPFLCFEGKQARDMFIFEPALVSTRLSMKVLSSEIESAVIEANRQECSVLVEFIEDNGSEI